MGTLKLLPCPFCGGGVLEWKFKGKEIVSCADTSCPGYGVISLPEEWNRRSDRAGLIAGLREALAEIAEGRGVCGTCGKLAEGPGPGFTACDCAYPYWSPRDPKSVARSALQPEGADDGR